MRLGPGGLLGGDVDAGAVLRAEGLALRAAVGVDLAHALAHAAAVGVVVDLAGHAVTGLGDLSSGTVGLWRLELKTE